MSSTYKTAEEAEKFCEISDEVFWERERQNTKWNRAPSEWNADPAIKLAVLLEEVGEVARGILEKDPKNVRTELVQVAAVCFAWLEAFDEEEVRQTSRFNMWCKHGYPVPQHRTFSLVCDMCAAEYAELILTDKVS